MRIVLLLFTLIVLSFCETPKTTEGKNPYQTSIDSARVLAQEMLNDNGIPGMAVAVSVKGELVWSEGFGFSNLDNESPVDPATTMFRIGSVSKTLTAAAVGKLMQTGKVDLDEKVQTYVPNFPEKRFPITVKQVAGHIAGIRHYRGNEMMSDKYYSTVTEGLEIFKNDALLFEPGTDYNYSSYGWNLVSAVVEGAAEDDFLTYMSKEVFNPLQMENTMADMASNEIPNRTNFYVRNEEGVVNAPYVDNSYKWAGGGFISSAEDLIKFGVAHTKPGFLSAEILGELQESQYLINGDTTEYGVGWASGIDERGYSFVGHSGGSVGGITQFWIYPKEEVIVAMVTNISPVRYGDTDSKIAWLFIEGKRE